MHQRSCSLYGLTLLVCLSGFIQVKAQQPAWSATGALGTMRTRHTATLLANGKVLVVGGSSVLSPCCRTVVSAELYDPATGQWSVTGSPGTPRYDHVAVRLSNGKVLIAGGSSDPVHFLNSAEIYDPDTGVWSTAANLPAARGFHGAVLLTDGRVLVTGGIVFGGAGNTTEVYDQVTNVWSSAGTMNGERSLPSG